MRAFKWSALEKRLNAAMAAQDAARTMRDSLQRGTDERWIWGCIAMDCGFEVTRLHRQWKRLRALQDGAA
jgi:hypothetical protein